MNKELPPEIRDEDDADLEADEALAQALHAFFGEKYKKVMSYLKSEQDAHRIVSMYAFSRRKGFEFLSKIADDKLLLACSTDKGVRARLLAEALKNMNGVGAEEKFGLTDRIKGAFKRDFVRE